MISVSPEIGFVVVSGGCALVFGLVVLRIKSQKKAGRASAESTAAPSPAPRPSAPEPRRDAIVPHAQISVRPSGILMCTESSQSSSKPTPGPAEPQTAQDTAQVEASRVNAAHPETVPHNETAPHYETAPHHENAAGYKFEATPAASEAATVVISADEKPELEAPENSALEHAARQEEVRVPRPAARASVEAGASRAKNSGAVATEESSPKVTSISKFKMAAAPEPVEQSRADAPAGPAERGSETVPASRTQTSAGEGQQTAAVQLLKFFGLRQQPFDVTPDPAFLYSSPWHREALATLTQGIEHFRGFMMLVSEPGMGKTMLLNRLMEDLGDRARVVFLFQTQYNSAELLSFILDELEVDHTGMDVVTMHRVLNQALLEEMLRGQRFVLIVDEAQNLQPSVLETIRLLSDFETTHSKLIQIVLSGQPRLSDTLAKPALAQLRQRIETVSQLKPLTTRETSEYIEHRMRAAGWTGSVPFTRDALALIAELSKGVPRTINNLCFNALLESFHCEELIADANMVRAAALKMKLELPARFMQSAPVPGTSPRASRTAGKRTAR